MKTSAINRRPITRRPISRYPNAADSRYYIRKLVDLLLTLATGIGFFVTLAFLFLM